MKEQAACVCAKTEGSGIFPDNPPQRLLVVFAALHYMPDKERGPARIFRHENQSTPQSLSKLGDKRTGKKADLQKCLERSPLGSGNAVEEEVLVAETNNTDYEKTVDPVTDDIAIEELSDFISGTELEPCTQEEEQLISKDGAAYLAADTSPEADVMILDGAYLMLKCSPPGH